MSVDVQALAAGYEMESDESSEEAITRREFLNYAWLASLGIFAAESGIVSYHFALPRLRPGQFGGIIPLGPLAELPPVGEAPAPFHEAKFWWIQTEQGAQALYKVCTHLGCIYDWKDVDNKFICPCHGSQFQRDGVLIRGPAARDLDRFIIIAEDESGVELARTPPDGAPVRLPENSVVKVDTGSRIVGQTRKV
jgi:cytochrome b6-f complex iron-sulfur subunit